MQEGACLLKAAGREAESRLNACTPRRDEYCGIRYSAHEQRGGAVRYLEREDVAFGADGATRQLLRYTVLSKQEDELIRAAERLCEMKRGSGDAISGKPPGPTRKSSTPALE